MKTMKWKHQILSLSKLDKPELKISSGLFDIIQTCVSLNSVQLWPKDVQNILNNQGSYLAQYKKQAEQLCCHYTEANHMTNLSWSAGWTNI